jgi:hypothetical protein
LARLKAKAAAEGEARANIKRYEYIMTNGCITSLFDINLAMVDFLALQKSMKSS